MKMKTRYGIVAICALVSVLLVMAVKAEEKQGTKKQKVQARSSVASETKRSTKEIKTISFPGLTKHELKIQKALNTEMECDFSETPLSEVMKLLAERYGIQIFLMTSALGEEGLTVNEPVSLKVKGIPLKNALNLMLEPKQLSYVVNHDVLKVTTIVKVDEEYKLRVYPVGDFDYTPKVKCHNTHMGRLGNAPKGYIELIDAIQESILDFDDSISPMKSSKSLVINTSYHKHIKVVELLKQLRRASVLD